MNNINNLCYFYAYKNHILHDFLKSTLIIYKSFLDKNKDDDSGGGDDEDDRPVIESVNTKFDDLLNFVDAFETDYNELTDVLKTPRKFVISSEIIEKKANCIRYIGDIKRLIDVQYNNTHSKESILLRNELRIYKNLSKNSYEEISSIIIVLIKKMGTDEFKASCETLKIDGLLTELSKENNLFSILLSERKEKKEITEYSAVPAREKCKLSYKNLIEYTNAMINYDRNTDYSTLVNKLNAEINPLNTNMRNHYKELNKKKDDRPVMESLNSEKDKSEIKEENNSFAVEENE